MRSRSEQGISLLEVLVYLAVLSVVLALASGAFFQVAKTSNDLKRNANDISQAMAVGERWRADIRAATKPPVVMHTTEGDAIWLAQGTNTVGYTVQHATVWRYTAGRWVPVLHRVRSAKVQESPRRHVQAWRWEIELATVQPMARVRPVFSFVAVNGGAR